MAAFLLFIAPGITYEMARERRRPGIPETPFRETNRIVLMSFVFTGFGFLALLALRGWLWPGSMPDVGHWLDHGYYLANHYRLVGRAVLVEQITAYALVGILLWRGPHAAAWIRDRPRRQPPRTLSPGWSPHSMWWVAFREDLDTVREAWPEVGPNPLVKAWLDNDEVIGGTLIRFDRSGEPDKRELLLQGATRWAAHSPPEMLGMVVIPGRVVRFLQYRYNDSPQPQAPRTAC